MVMPKRGAKRDASEPEIVSILRQCGFSVYLTDRPVDAIVGFRGRTWLVEIKTGRKAYGKALNENQQKFSDGWRGTPVVVLHDAQEAMDWCVEMAKNMEDAA